MGRTSLTRVQIAGLAVLGGVLTAGRVLAAPIDDAEQRVKTAQREVEGALAGVRTQLSEVLRYDPARMVAEAELYLRSGQPAEASAVLNRVAELGAQGRAPKVSEAQAHFLLGEAYLQTDELYSAKREFEIVIDRHEDEAFRPYGPKAASRLVDASLRTGRREHLPSVLERVEMLSRGQTSEALSYARAKVLLAMDRYDDALGVVAGIESRSVHAQRAAYLRGVALMKKARARLEGATEGTRPDYRAAIAAFELATVPGTDDTGRDASKIAELAQLAVARLHFDEGRFSSAARAYERVPRTSEYFAEALFELSWTYVRIGDYERGGRALDALRVLDPGLIDGADAALLRADLLLRAGRYAEAEKAYEVARAAYDPLRQQVRDYLSENLDPALYYDKLTGSQIEVGPGVSPEVVAWAREEAREDRVFAIVDDVSRARAMVKDARKRVTLVRSALGGATRAKAFPEIRRELEKVLGMQNKISTARLSLARALDRDAGAGSGELARVRAERRSLMARAQGAPVDPADFSARDAESERSWNSVSQGLQRLELEADHLQALVNGLRVMLRDAERHGIAASDASIERYRRELAENEKDMQGYRERIATYREQVEVGRAAAGFGDERFLEDDRVREKFRQLFEKELSLVAGGAEPDTRAVATRITASLSVLGALEGKVAAVRQRLEAEALARSSNLDERMRVESALMEDYAARLDTLDQHARVLVGEVARDNFARVEARLRDVVMRADVGIVQKAWEIREEQRMRLQDLQRERAREEAFINDELREVLDDAEEGQ